VRGEMGRVCFNDFGFGARGALATLTSPGRSIFMIRKSVDTGNTGQMKLCPEMASALNANVNALPEPWSLRAASRRQVDTAVGNPAIPLFSYSAVGSR
jgi:predicted aspartyl protease